MQMTMIHCFPRLPARLSPRLACTIFRQPIGRRILLWVDIDLDLHPANDSAAAVLDGAVTLFVAACCPLPVAMVIQKEPFLLAKESPSWSMVVNTLSVYNAANDLFMRKLSLLDPNRVKVQIFF